MTLGSVVKFSLNRTLKASDVSSTYSVFSRLSCLSHPTYQLLYILFNHLQLSFFSPQFSFSFLFFPLFSSLPFFSCPPHPRQWRPCLPRSVQFYTLYLFLFTLSLSLSPAVEVLVLLSPSSGILQRRRPLATWPAAASPCLRALRRLLLPPLASRGPACRPLPCSLRRRVAAVQAQGRRAV